MKIIVVGGGIAGLYLALNLCRKHEVIILDDRKYIGGRIRTNEAPQYEIGAARFHKQHVLLMRLISRYKLQKVSIASAAAYYDAKCLQFVPNSYDLFDACIRKILNRSKLLTTTQLRSMTFAELCQHVQHDMDVNQLINIFGYRCEFAYMNAFDACRTFELDFVSKQYYSLKDGLSSLCKRMAKEICENGGRVHLRAKVRQVMYHQFKLRVVTDSAEYFADKVVFAIKPHQMKQFSILRPIHSLLASVQAGQLLRIIARFPCEKGKGPWFSGLPKITTDSFLRQIVPLSESTGLIMVSYTDGSDVDHFLASKNRLRADVQKIVMAELRRLFGCVPDPTYFRTHYWSEGCHYWCKNANSRVISERLVHPCPHVYTCGEGFSLKQAWMEGAIESAHKVMERLTYDQKTSLLPLSP